VTKLHTDSSFLPLAALTPSLGVEHVPRSEHSGGVNVIYLFYNIQELNMRSKDGQ